MGPEEIIYIEDTTQIMFTKEFARILITGLFLLLLVCLTFHPQAEAHRKFRRCVGYRYSCNKRTKVCKILKKLNG